MAAEKFKTSCHVTENNLNWYQYCVCKNKPKEEDIKLYADDTVSMNKNSNFLFGTTGLQIYFQDWWAEVTHGAKK